MYILWNSVNFAYWSCLMIFEDLMYTENCLHPLSSNDDDSESMPFWYHHNDDTYIIFELVNAKGIFSVKNVLRSLSYISEL